MITWVSVLETRRLAVDKAYRDLVYDNIQNGWVFLSLPKYATYESLTHIGDKNYINIRLHNTVKIIQISAPGIVNVMI
jgi:hypothetical protein